MGWWSRPWFAPLALVWLLLPVPDLTERASGASLVVTLVAVAVFGLCFVHVALTMARPESPGPTRVTWLCTAVMGAVAVAVPLLQRDVHWISLQVYFTIVLTFVLPLSLVPRGILAGVALTAVQGTVSGSGTSETVAATLTVLGLSMTTFGLRRSRILVQRIREAQGQVARLAAVEERLRIARDLHDLVGHSLSLIVVKSELAGRLSEIDPRAAAGEIADVESVARESLVQVRDAVTGYRQRSLLEEVDDARSALAAADVQAVVRLPGTPLPEDVDRLLAWVVREGVTNVIRHAQASRCEITVTRDEETAVLGIVDDGRGPSGDDGPGNGLTGLTERVETAGGRLDFGTRNGRRGFRLAVRVPLTSRPAAGQVSGA